MAYTEICTGSARVVAVEARLSLSSIREIDEFEKALAKYGRGRGYSVGPFTAQGSTKMDFWLYIPGTSEAIEIQNRRDPLVAVAGMSECGSLKFMPYWKQYLDFIEEYASRRQ